jgi:uncharacterized protein YjcR
MNATPVIQTDKEQIRMLVLSIGYDQTAERTGIKPATLRKWAERGNWWAKAKPTKAVTNVTRQPADILSDTLAEHERETRLSLARYASRAAKDAEQASLRDAPLVHKAAQVAGIVHKWDSEKSNQTFTLNVLNINSLDNRLGNDSEVIDT